MAESGVAALEFLNYKITGLNYFVKPMVALVLGNFTNIDWQFMHDFQPTLHSESNNIYISQFDFRVACFEIGDFKPLPDEEPYIALSGEITGMFRFDNDSELSDDQKNNLIRFQAPAILSPYLRGALSSILALSGWPGAVFPLLNIYKMAQQEQLPVIELDRLSEDEADEQNL